MACSSTVRRGLPVAGAAVALVAAISGYTGARAQPPGPPARTPGYLTADQVAASIRFLGPPPAAGSGAKTGDVQTYEATRRLHGTPRWDLATRDDSVGAAQMAANNTNTVGVR